MLESIINNNIIIFPSIPTFSSCTHNSIVKDKAQTRTGSTYADKSVRSKKMYIHIKRSAES